MPDYWTDSFDLEDFELMTGPAKIQDPPQMGRGDRVIFHAVIHVALFAAGEILGNPRFSRERQWAPLAVALPVSSRRVAPANH
jgi:hypothetical protein